MRSGLKSEIFRVARQHVGEIEAWVLLSSWQLLYQSVKIEQQENKGCI